MLPRRRLGDHAGDLAARARRTRPRTASRSLYGSTIVSPACAPVTPGVSGSPRVATPGAGGGQQRVHVAVVAAGELHHLGAAGEAAGQPDRRHRRLGAGRHQPHLLDRLDPGRRSPRRARPRPRSACRRRCRAPTARLDGRDHLGVRVPEDHRPPRADQVDVLAAVGVGQVRAGAGHHEPGRAAHGAERPHRRVHPARRHQPPRGRRVPGTLGFVRIAHRPCSQTPGVAPQRLDLASDTMIGLRGWGGGWSGSGMQQRGGGPGEGTGRPRARRPPHRQATPTRRPRTAESTVPPGP